MVWKKFAAGFSVQLYKSYRYLVWLFGFFLIPFKIEELVDVVNVCVDLFLLI